MKRPILTICSSAAFYRQAVDAKKELADFGFEVILPRTALRMEKTGDFEVDHYKTWYENADDYHKKSELMRAHFDEVAKGDIILVLNYEKHGQQNYIGGNVLMEMSLAFYLKKPIYVLNDLPNDSPFIEELRGMGAVPLYGEIELLRDKL